MDAIGKMRILERCIRQVYLQLSHDVRLDEEFVGLLEQSCAALSSHKRNLKAFPPHIPQGERKARGYEASMRHHTSHSNMSASIVGYSNREDNAMGSSRSHNKYLNQFMGHPRTTRLNGSTTREKIETENGDGRFEKKNLTRDGSGLNHSKSRVFTSGNLALGNNNGASSRITPVKIRSIDHRKDADSDSRVMNNNMSSNDRLLHILTGHKKSSTSDKARFEMAFETIYEKKGEEGSSKNNKNNISFGFNFNHNNKPYESSKDRAKPGLAEHTNNNSSRLQQSTSGLGIGGGLYSKDRKDNTQKHNNPPQQSTSPSKQPQNDSVLKIRLKDILRYNEKSKYTQQ